MDKILQRINILWGACVAFLAGIFGEFWFLFAAFLFLNIVDYITGVMKARLTHTENSNKGLKGICKKVGYWIVVAIAFFITICFKEMGVILGINLAFVTLAGWFCLATFIINECRSILENLVIIGVDVPPFLIKGLEVAAEAVDKTSNKNN